MLLSLSQWLLALYPDEFSFLRVFQYITFRAVFATITAITIGLVAGPVVIRKLTELKVGQAVRSLDRMTQQNAALVDRTAGSASDMRELARTLAEEVARYRLPMEAA